jgi:hypothetical protein
MNSLTKFLLEDILEADKKKITAIYGGGFKPPTKGHFDVVAKAAEQNPEIDEFIIYVGGGVRDGIAQAESIMIWEIYKKYLPLKVRIEPVKTPVGDILRYAKEHPEEEVLWVIGARENNPEDFADIASRTRTLDKYPNLELRLIQTAGGVSGTATRKAVRDNNKEQFYTLIPDIEEKDQVWDIVSPIVTEGILDKTKELISNFQLAYKNQKGDFEGFKDLFKKYISKQELTPEEKEKLNRNVIDIFKMSTIPILGISGTTLLGTLTNFLSKGKFSTFPSKFKDKLLSINEVGEANLEPYKWEEVDSGRTTSVEFITPSETKYEVDLMHTEIDDPEDEDMSLEALDIEFLAKPKGAEGSSSKIVVNKGELYRVMSTIVDVIKHYLRKYRGDIIAIIYSPSKKSSEENFGNQRDNLYRAFILKAFPDAKIEQQGENIITYLPDNTMVTEADPKKGTGKKPKGSGRRLYTDEDPSDTVKVKFKTKEDIVDTLNKESFKSKSHARQSQVINLIHQRVRAAYGKAKDPEVKSRLKRALDYIEKRKEMSKKKTERLRKLKEEITRSDLNQIERIADEWFEDYGIDVTFTHHFLDRVNDPRNGKPISPEELEDIFTQSAEKYGVKLSQLPDNFEAVLLKLRNDINVPFALNYDEKNDEIDLVAKTIMRKKDFKTSNPKLTLEKITNTEIICDNCGWTWKIKDGGNDLYICHKCGHDNSPKQLNENSIPSIDIKDKIDQINKYMIDKGHNMQPLPSVEFIEDDQENAENFLGKTAYYDPNNKKIVLYTFGRHPKDICRSYTHEMIHHIQNLENRLGNVTTTNTLEDDNIDKLEQEANLKGTMTFRNWTDSLQEKKNKDPFGINAYALELARDLEESLNKEENVNKIWKTNQISLPLPTLESKYKLKQVMKEEETPQQYEIYCDMDGVLVDFDKGYKNLTGQETHHVDLQGKDEFWGTFRQSLEDKKMQEKDYWANLEWMPDGKELWDHIQSMKPTLLSAPSRDPQSRWGKRIWVKKNIPGTPLILAAASAKKNYANKNSILIDDRISNVNEWNAAGGIGILHTSTSSTIEKLSKYGL